MLSRDLMYRIRRLQLRAKRAVEDPLGGEYRSVFKGAGVAFEEVREYQPGDDIRSIDWNVTARMGHLFVKRYIEERELTLLLVVDASASHQFGTGPLSKREVTAELAALLAFCAAGSNDKVGLLLFSDRVEKYVAPRKGPRHVLRLIRELLFFQPKGRETRLRVALDYLGRVARRRAIVFLFSDFLDHGFEGALKRTGRRHDLIAVTITDPGEQAWPNLGLVEWESAETGDRLIIDAANPLAREAFAHTRRQQVDELAKCCRAAAIDQITASTQGDHLDALTRFFYLRQRRLGRA